MRPTGVKGKNWEKYLRSSAPVPEEVELAEAERFCMTGESGEGVLLVESELHGAFWRD